MKQTNAKGLLFHYLKEWVVKRGGEQEWTSLLARLEPADAQVLNDIVLAGGWYPIGIWNRVVGTYMGKFPDPNVAMAEFCTFLGDRELNSLVKMVLRFGSPGFLLKRTTFLWNRYFEAGAFGAEEVEPRKWRLWLEAPTSIEAGASKLTCANGPAPWLERGLHLSGATAGRVQHVKCRHEGHPRCEFIAEW